MGALTLSTSTFSYRAWEIVALRIKNIVDALAVPIQLSLMNDTIIRVLALVVKEEWLANATRHGFNASAENMVNYTQVYNMYKLIKIIIHDIFTSVKDLLNTLAKYMGFAYIMARKVVNMVYFLLSGLIKNSVANLYNLANIRVVSSKLLRPHYNIMLPILKNIIKSFLPTSLKTEDYVHVSFRAENYGYSLIKNLNFVVPLVKESIQSDALPFVSLPINNYAYLLYYYVRLHLMLILFFGGFFAAILEWINRVFGVKSPQVSEDDFTPTLAVNDSNAEPLAEESNPGFLSGIWGAIKRFFTRSQKSNNTGSEGTVSDDTGSEGTASDDIGSVTAQNDFDINTLNLPFNFVADHNELAALLPRLSQKDLDTFSYYFSLKFEYHLSLAQLKGLLAAKLSHINSAELDALVNTFYDHINHAAPFITPLTQLSIDITQNSPDVDSDRVFSELNQISVNSLNSLVRYGIANGMSPEAIIFMVKLHVRASRELIHDMVLELLCDVKYANYDESFVLAADQCVLTAKQLAINIKNMLQNGESVENVQAYANNITYYGEYKSAKNFEDFVDIHIMIYMPPNIEPVDLALRIDSSALKLEYTTVPKVSGPSKVLSIKNTPNNTDRNVIDNLEDIKNSHSLSQTPPINTGMVQLNDELPYLNFDLTYILIKMLGQICFVMKPLFLPTLVLGYYGLLIFIFYTYWKQWGWLFKLECIEKYRDTKRKYMKIMYGESYTK